VLLICFAFWEIFPSQVFASDATSAELPRPSEVAHRSVRMDLPRAVDELDLPRQGLRASHQGWETRTRHFVVFSTLGPEQAAWAAGQLEQAWHDVGLLADQWTDAHRAEGFGVGAVNVLVVDNSRDHRTGPAWVLPGADDSASIFLEMDGRGSIARPLVGRLRREAFGAFLRLAQQDLILPDWVQAGLAAYVSGEPLPWDQVASLRPLESLERGMGNPTIRRPTSDRVTIPAVDREQAAFWVRYLIEGDDGRHAPMFFDALASVAAEVQSPPGDGGAPIGTDAGFAGKDRRPSLVDRLPRTASFEEGAAQWLADPEVERPIIRSSSATTELEERHRRMVLILKLAKRFPVSPSQAVRPKVYSFSGGRFETEPVSAAKEDTPMSPAELYRRLAELPRWATIDTDGSLLWSDDKERLAEVFGLANPRLEYRSYREDGRTVLEAGDLDRGDVWKAWLEENRENPRRPIANIERVSTDPLFRGANR
jgi:hypothetical protein